MASLQQDPSGSWHIHFRLGGRRFKRSLQTKKESEATSLCGRIEDNIQLVTRGAMTIPPGADAFVFLLTDGKLERSIVLPERLTLGELLGRYQQAMANELEDTTLGTIGVHVRHFERILGEKSDPRGLTLSQLDDYVRTRQKENNRQGRLVSATTVRKEIATLSAIWSWAEGRYDLNPLPNTKRLSYTKVAERPPFQTWQEIELRFPEAGSRKNSSENCGIAFFYRSRRLRRSWITWNVQRPRRSCIRWWSWQHTRVREDRNSCDHKFPIFKVAS